MGVFYSNPIFLPWHRNLVVDQKNKKEVEMALLFPMNLAKFASFVITLLVIVVVGDCIRIICRMSPCPKANPPLPIETVFQLPTPLPIWPSGIYLLIWSLVCVWHELFLLTYSTIQLIFATIHRSRYTFWYYSWVSLYYFS